MDQGRRQVQKDACILSVGQTFIQHSAGLCLWYAYIREEKGKKGYQQTPDLVQHFMPFAPGN